ncbi:MAG: glycoside hydrolase family 3 C-terminal domain-containing protein [Lachnospiraceae bacterium]|nr:glycoside hydrolase family 3 C-terminal domain-containing protein [Lachnospiraceae bacterium]
MAKIRASKDNSMSAAEQAHLDLSRQLAGECPVLLENDGTLPLDLSANGRKIALYGRGVRQTIKGGTGSGDVNTRFSVTVEEGLKEAGFAIATNDWLDRNSAFYAKKKEEYEEQLAAAAAKAGIPTFLMAFGMPFAEPADLLIEPSELKGDADTALYVISRNSGEGSDRQNVPGDYAFFPEELDNIRQCADFYQHTVVVLNIGGVMDLSHLKQIDGISAVLLMNQLGNIGGHVLADILTGKVNPSGKLVDTWALQYSDYPSSAAFSSNDGNVDDEYYTEDIYVGYRYFDSFDVKPLYAFGYGLSYTTFALETKSVAQNGDRITVTVSVKNAGNVAGKEVVQLYVSKPDGKLEKPYQELVAFAKTSLLQAGAEETLTITFPITQLSSYCENCASWVIADGDYVLRIGNASDVTEIAAKLVVPELTKTEVLKNLFAEKTAKGDPLDGAWDEHEKLSTRGTDCGKRKQADADKAALILTLDMSKVTCNETRYSPVPRAELTTTHTEKLAMDDVRSGKCKVEDLVAQLSVEELADLCVGSLRAGLASVIGEASATVPGAAGDTSSNLWSERGIRNLILADGPAGIRLTPHFRTDLDGNLLKGGETFGTTTQPFPEMEEGTYIDYYQYCTAIPIGWALASSWNAGLLEETGKMIGEEMDRFGVDLWLAPAMNIHRNPLCGRNFEYYSEDPYISGIAAAAITKGVQSATKGGTTIKHYAANNQENNRNYTNSHISERALREIYLKGYEICVKIAQPLSVMTSYNLINGTHSACNYDLIQAVLRDEWGFGGVVMTDWFASKDMPEIAPPSEIYPCSSPTGCVYAGNDLQMPGGQDLVDDLIASAKDDKEVLNFRCSKADLQFCACNLLRVIAGM